MEKLALLVRLQARPGKEQELHEFLKAGAELARAEPDTQRWYALQLAPGTFGIFDTFEHEAGRQAHLEGPIARLLMQKAGELLDAPPTIEKVALLAVK